MAAGALIAVALGAVAFGAYALLAPTTRETVERFAQAWERRDYARMHALVTDAARRDYPAPDFARRYREAAATATLVGLDVGAPDDTGDGEWRLPVRIETRAFGTIRASVDVDVEGDGDDARVDWGPQLTFPGLIRGTVLRRETRLPERATLLARDGTPLAEGPLRTSALGPAAVAATGALGPIPAEQAAAMRALGYPADAQIGVSGLERIFERRLAGRPGGELRAGARLLASTEPRKSRPVRTTIAPGVQAAVVAALGPRLGGIVALRPRSGEILGFAGIAFSGLQPPGSTFKLITLTGALEAKVAKPSDTFPVQTATTLSGVELENANGEACGGTLTNSFAHSCNSVFAPLGVKLGARRLVDVATRFGFNRRPDIPGAATSTIPAANEIGDDLALGSTAIGQGRVQATALQLASVAATIALRGRRPELTLGGAPGGAAPTRRVTSTAVARTVERMMLAVVRFGTGTAAAIDGVKVAGKTGTAELRETQKCDPDPENPESCPEDQQADPTDTDAWFAAYAPAGSPRIAVGVMLVGAGAGGDTAAPAARQVMVAALS